MAITISATVGSASANSFVTEAEFIAYLVPRLNAHSGATVSGSTCSETEKAALVEAGIWFDTLDWQGTRTDGTQALAWPRAYVLDPDAPDITALADALDVYYDDDEIPGRVKRGQMALAVEFLKAGTTDIAALDATIGVLEKTVDVLTTRYAEPYQRAQGLARFPRVLAEIGPLLKGASGSLDVVRV